MTRFESFNWLHHYQINSSFSFFLFSNGKTAVQWSQGNSHVVIESEFKSYNENYSFLIN